MSPEKQKVISAIEKLGDAYGGLREAYQQVFAAVSRYDSALPLPGSLPQFPALLQLGGLFSAQPPPAAAPLASTTSAGGQKRKRGLSKVKKDPNAPKRPVSAYLAYQGTVQKEFRAKYSDLAYFQVLQKISAVWHAMTEEEKQPWEDIYEANKAVYNAAKAEYEAKREGKGKVTNDNDGSATSPAASVSGGASGSNGGRPSSSSSATVAGETGKEKSKKAKKAVQSSSSTHTKAEHGQAFGASDRDSNGDILVNSKASGKGKATSSSSSTHKTVAPVPVRPHLLALSRFRVQILPLPPFPVETSLTRAAASRSERTTARSLRSRVSGCNSSSEEDESEEEEDTAVSPTSQGKEQQKEKHVSKKVKR